MQKRMLTEAAAGCISGTAALLLLYAARRSAKFADWYAEHIYPVWVGTLGRINGLFPFSVAEILLYVLAGLAVVTLLWLVIATIRKRAGYVHWLQTGVRAFCMAAILLFLYAACCGVNYYREGFAKSIALEEREYTIEELKQVCERLTDEVNRWAYAANSNANAKEIQQQAVAAMEQQGERYDVLAGYYPRPKQLLNSWILSVQNLTGVYAPFTVEANYNGSITAYNIPFTACHELSHLKGFMQEDEANFIAYLACIQSAEPKFRYSGSMMAWIYCTNVLSREDEEAYRQIRAKLEDRVLQDLTDNRTFWAQYEGKIAEVSGKVNDTYLKKNGQDDGVQSYDRMVDLVISYELLQMEKKD